MLGDQVRLHQIMWNLLSNAIKFTPTGGRIEVRLRRVGTQVEIEVEDTGEGISPEFLPFVFDRFRQQDSSKRRHHGGLGLGLAIVRYLVELHGGKASAKSNGRGKGSVFTISLPLMAVRNQISETVIQEPKTLELPHSEPSLVMGAGSRRLEGLQILAIDDSPDSLQVLRLLLKRNGASVVAAASAAEALDILKSTTPDIIICDIGMPGEDGYSFLQRLRKIETSEGKSHIPAAALTAYTREEEKQEAFKSGFQVHLSKPIQEALLIHSVARLAGL